MVDLDRVLLTAAAHRLQNEILLSPSLLSFA